MKLARPSSATRRRLALAASAALALALLAQATPARASTLARAGDAAAERVRMVAAVEGGLAAADVRWGWKGWYRDTPADDEYASIWETVHLFEAYVGLAAAAPTPAHLRALTGFATRSEGYWNPRLAHGVGGFTTGYRVAGDVVPNWFDDNGWLGLAFVDAYRVTRDARFLRDARRAFRYLWVAGWDEAGGGIWWNTERTFKSAESVNTAALLAILLFQVTGERTYLGRARTLVDWADAHLREPGSGLYVNRPQGGGPISYLQSPLLDAKVRLCRSRGLYCDDVEPLTLAVVHAYGGRVKSSPQYDAMYLRYLVDAYAVDGDPRLYDVVYANVLRIEESGAAPDGVFVHDWDGGTSGVTPGLVSVHGATVEALAWAAAAEPPPAAADAP